MSKSISKSELIKLISKTTQEVFERNSNLLDNPLVPTIEISVNIASYVTMKILDELDVLKLEE